MRTMQTALTVMGSLCLTTMAATAAFAANEAAADATGAGAERGASVSKDGVLERRVYLPNVLGFGVGSGLAAGAILGGTGAGFAAYPTGIVWYTSSDATSAQGGAAHADTLTINPSIDVRAGRFTVGGAASFASMRSLQLGFGQSNATSFTLAPRVGYLIPLVRDLALWPRASVGFLVASSSGSGFPTTLAGGFLASADVLLVASLGSHFFLTAGPSGSFTAVSSPNGSSSSFGIGANIGLGIAL